MLFVNDENILEKIKKIKSKSGYFTSGTNVISALLLAQLKRYDQILENRDKIARKYNNEINPDLNGIERYWENTGMHYRYVLGSENNWENILEAYSSEGIHVRKSVDQLIHRTKILNDGDFPNSVNCFEKAVSIPVLPQLSEEQTNKIVVVTNRLKTKGIL